MTAKSTLDRNRCCGLIRFCGRIRISLTLVIGGSTPNFWHRAPTRYRHSTSQMPAEKPEKISRYSCFCASYSAWNFDACAPVQPGTAGIVRSKDSFFISSAFEIMGSKKIGLPMLYPTIIEAWNGSLRSTSADGTACIPICGKHMKYFGSGRKVPTLSVPSAVPTGSELFPSEHDTKCRRFGVGSHPESGFQDIDVAQSHGTQIETRRKAAN